jgi:hypothetical protein
MYYQTNTLECQVIGLQTIECEVVLSDHADIMWPSNQGDYRTKCFFSICMLSGLLSSDVDCRIGCRRKQYFIGRLEIIMDLVIGQKVSGVYWNKGSDSNGYCVPIRDKPFRDGIVIGFTKSGRPIIQVTSGNLIFNVYRTEITK